MGAETTKQDYDELEMLLGEIPNAMSRNPQARESDRTNSSPGLVPISIEEDRRLSPSSNFTNCYNSPQVKHEGSLALYGGLSFPRSPFDLKLKSNEILDNVNSDSTVAVDQNEPKLPDEQSLRLAFEKMSFKDGVAMESTSCHTSLSNDRYPTHLNNSFSWPNSVTVSTPPLPATLNGVNLPGPAFESYLPFVSTDGINKFNGEICGRDDANVFKLNVHELKKQFLENSPSYFMEQQQENFLVHSGATPVNPPMHSFPLVPGVSASEQVLPSSTLQQQYYLDCQSLDYMPSQQLSQTYMGCQSMEEERYFRMHQEYYYLQQLRNQETQIHQIRNGTYSATRPLSGTTTQPYFEMPLSHQIEQGNLYSYWNDIAVQRGYDQLDIPLVGDGLCQYCAQGLCRKHQRCRFPHGQKVTSASGLTSSAKDFLGQQVLDKAGKQISPEKILTRSHGVNALKRIKPCSITTNQSLKHSLVLSDGYLHQLEGQDFQGSFPDSSDLRLPSKSLQQKYNSVNEVAGRIYFMAKDQHGCRCLQRKFTEGTPEDVQKIFVEIIGHIAELMTDPFGNYLVQKLLEVCNEDQRMRILHAITSKAGELFRVSCNMHGTRAVQKVIETLKTTDQFSMIVSSLKPCIVSLMKDINGTHVAQRCLQHLLPEYNKFLFDAAIAHCVELATDRQGCCVLQKCLYHSYGEQMHLLMSKITSNALLLSQDPYGNYVVQYILDQKIPWVIADVLNQLEGSYGYLSMLKYSSNVVEKCLKLVEGDKLAQIIHELVNSPELVQILEDPFGNYVIQSALSVCKGALRAAFVDAIRPHVPVLWSSPYGKKVLTSIGLRK